MELGIDDTKERRRFYRHVNPQSPWLHLSMEVQSGSRLRIMEAEIIHVIDESGCQHDDDDNSLALVDKGRNDQ